MVCRLTAAGRNCLIYVKLPEEEKREIVLDSVINIRGSMNNSDR
jgi:hypothetical protein